MKLTKQETSLEAVQNLFEFFQSDMWYAKEIEWKKEKDMHKYLKKHFDICMKSIRRNRK